MGGDGYALGRALSGATLAQLRSREKRARSDLPRRSPSEMYELSRRAVEDCMENSGSTVGANLVGRAQVETRNFSSPDFSFRFSKHSLRSTGRSASRCTRVRYTSVSAVGVEFATAVLVSYCVSVYVPFQSAKLGGH